MELMCAWQDIKQRPREVICQIAQFLEVDSSPELLDSIMEHCTFDAMKKAHADSMAAIGNAGAVRAEGEQGHFRGGRIGDWKEYFTQVQAERFEEAMRIHS